MGLSNIDTTRDFRTPDELLELVEAIHNSPATAQETNWLEWKSTLDLATAEGRFAVGKAILGFANRAVDQARLNCAGLAYMVVGVKPGAATGVKTVDHAALVHRIKTYVAGPRWTPNYVSFLNVEVLVIVIEPPRAGDPIHTLQKGFSNDKAGSKAGHSAGTIFHRGAALTEPAGPNEVAMLQERLLHGVRQPDLDLVLTPAAEPLTRLNVGREFVNEWLKRHEQHVRATSGEPPPPPPREPQAPYEHLAVFSSLASSIGSTILAGMYSDPKNREEFNQRVKNYLAKVRRALVGNIVKSIVLSDDKNKVYFTVGNLTDDPVAGVHLTVIVPNCNLLVFTSAPNADQFPPLPKWPDDFRDRMASDVALSALHQDYDFNPHGGSVTETTAGFEITWDIGDLTPGRSSRQLEITIVPGLGAPDEVEVTMRASAMNRRRTANGKTTISITSEQWTPNDFFVAEPDAKD